MAVLLDKKVKLFSLSANPELAQEIANSIGVPLGDLKVLRFADGEVNVSINETVRGHHVFVVQPTTAPVNEHLMEMLILCDALKRASAKTINLIIPYYGYCRQDRKSKSREPISAKLVADLIQTAGATRVIAMDLHAAQIQGFFDIPIDNFLGLPILVDYIIDKQIGFVNNATENLCVVSPDHGGAVRARNFAKVLQCPIAIVDKRRPEANKAEVMNIVGDVKGKTCIIVDDIVDTAGTLCAGAEALIKAGAKEVYAACTHGLFNGEAISRIEKSQISKMICTNTVKLSEEKKSNKIVTLSVGRLLGHGIKNILLDEPISSLFTYGDPQR